IVFDNLVADIIHLLAPCPGWLLRVPCPTAMASKQDLRCRARLIAQSVRRPPLDHWPRAVAHCCILCGSGRELKAPLDDAAALKQERSRSSKFCNKTPDPVR